MNHSTAKITVTNHSLHKVFLEVGEVERRCFGTYFTSPAFLLPWLGEQRSCITRSDFPQAAGPYPVLGALWRPVPQFHLSAMVGESLWRAGSCDKKPATADRS